MSPAALLAGLRTGLARLWGRSLAVTIAVTVILAVLLGLAERAASEPGAGDRALAAIFRFVVPLSAAAISAVAIGRANLRDAAWPAARFGHARGLVAAGIVLASGAATAVVALACALAALLAARVGANAGPWALPLPADLATTSWIAVLVAVAYAAWLGLGAGFGKQGGGRAAVLVADFVVGGIGGFGLVLPRGCAMTLVGFEPPLDVPRAVTSVALGAMACACTGLAAWRCRD